MGADRAPSSVWGRFAQVLRRFGAAVWPLAQQAAAATVAWVIADQVGSHDEAFFAPIAAVVALNATAGERGTNAVRLLAGVVLGILSGELAMSFLGGGYASLALATFAAVLAARAIRGHPLVIAQAAAGAILTVAVADGEAGVNRLIDALIGAGVALTFSQLLFTPEPVSLLRRVVATTLTDTAHGLNLTARALSYNDDETGEQAVAALRDPHDRLSDLTRARRMSRSVVRHSLVWRSRARSIARERENAEHLDLLMGSCLMLARTALAVDPDGRRSLAPYVRRLADVVEDMAADPGDRDARQRAADRILKNTVAALNDTELATDPAGTDAIAALRMVTVDILIFAGVPSEHAAKAVLGDSDRFRVPEPPDSRRLPFLPKLVRRQRWIDAPEDPRGNR